MKTKLLITGGAGFIGSNLVERFLADDRISLVRVVDDLSTGCRSNITDFENHPRFEFILGDICDYTICQQATRGITLVSHQAALGSVPRSIENPGRTNEVNVGGTLNVLKAAHEAGVRRVVLAFSSSTYGDSAELPKSEDHIGLPLSPYAVSKYAAELYAHVFWKTFGLPYVGLRYFNVFGPRQSATGAYAAVIPIFCRAFAESRQPRINGDGTSSRDFTHVENVVAANQLALFTKDPRALNQVYNVGCGHQTSLNDIVGLLQQISGKRISAIHGPERRGDVRHSLADISKIRTLLGYTPVIDLAEGLRRVYSSYEDTDSTGDSSEGNLVYTNGLQSDDE